MKKVTPAAIALVLLGTLPVFANDSMGELAAGGLTFLTNDKIEMVTEDLSVSPDEVKVVYKFHNKTNQDQHILVAFPMPDITGDPDFGYIIPTDDTENIFGFHTTFNGKPVDAALHQYAFVNNIDYSDVLKKLGIPLAPAATATQAAIKALPEADRQQLIDLGLVYWSGEGLDFDLAPIWTLRSAYSWEATFPAGQDAAVVHTYKPSVGRSNGVYFIGAPDDEPANARLAEYRTRYCVGDDMVETLRKSADPTADIYAFGIPYTENWISYIWSTGANWAGPLAKFTLTVDAGSPKNLVAFCGDNIRMISPGVFLMTATDWTPPGGHELEILLIKPDDLQP